VTGRDGARLRDGAGGQGGPAFIRSQTRLAPVPLVPEISLHIAADAIDLWHRTEQQAGREQLPPPFWGFPWAGGQALARYLLDNPGTVRQRSVLDIGSGSGLVAIAAMRAGAASVTASEIDPLAAAAITLNCAANGVRPAAIVGDVLGSVAPGGDGTGPPPGSAGVVLAGDAFYERALAGRLLPFLQRSRAAGTLVLVGDPGRAYLPRDHFEQVAIYQVPVSRVLEDATLKETTVWRLR
jgi:predicted nicotinamide N-methyase